MKYEINPSVAITLEQLKKGDKDAFGSLVAKTSERLYRLVFRMTGDEMEAEDILQDTYLKAFTGIASFEGRSSLETWLYRIAMNEVFMRYRKKSAPQVSIDEEVQGDEGLNEPLQIVDWCCLPEAELLDQESKTMLNQAADELSPGLRAVFILRDIQGLSIQDTAEILNISEGAVKTRLLRARLMLREKLSRYYSEKMERRSGHA